MERHGQEGAPEAALAEPASFDAIAGVIRDYGQPYDGMSLCYTGSRAQVACQACGPLPADVHDWSTDWLTLCQQARRHALTRGPGHKVAVSLWNGAVYGPVDGTEAAAGDA